MSQEFGSWFRLWVRNVVIVMSQVGISLSKSGIIHVAQCIHPIKSRVQIIVHSGQITEVNVNSVEGID